MRAIVQDAYGSADGMRIAEIERPAIAANEVLVKVRVAGDGSGHLAFHDGPAVPIPHHGGRVSLPEESRPQ
jgi:NADPH:quinone reductase-like Zn-dependent oxidoreductase